MERSFLAETCDSIRYRHHREHVESAQPIHEYRCLNQRPIDPHRMCSGQSGGCGEREDSRDAILLRITDYIAHVSGSSQAAHTSREVNIVPRTRMRRS